MPYQRIALQSSEHSNNILFYFSFFFLCIALIIYSTKSEASSTYDTLQESQTDESMDNYWIKHTLVKGDNLSSAFLKAGLSINEALNFAESVSQSNPFEKLFPGEELAFLLVNKQLKTLRYTNKQNLSVIISKPTSTDKFSIIETTSTLSATETLAIKEPEKNPALANNTNPTPQVSNAIKAKMKLPEALQTQHSAAQQIIYYRVEPNDNLSHLLKRAGLPKVDAINLANSQPSDLFRRLKAGQRIGVLIHQGHLIRLEYEIDKLKTLTFTRTGNTSYVLRSLEKEPVEKLKFAEGVINQSFFIDALNAGLTDNEAMNFTIPFRWDVDFSQDIHPGDKFKVVYLNNTIDGEMINTGKVLIAQLTTQGKEHTGIFFTSANGESNYYTPQGRLMRKTFLRMPIELARISSKFNPRRRHPITNKIRAHKGVDYAAKRGTPIMAAGSGKIIHIGWKGDYGKTIVIQHDAATTTLYAHMSGFSRALKRGSKVTQKQIIGYVGTTGAVTGAHLHYEFRVNGVHKNPLTVKLPEATILPPNELKLFKRVADSALKKLNSFNQKLVKRYAPSTNI